MGADRVLAILLELAEHPQGITLEELAAQLHSTKPTIHRALGALRRAGLASQSGRGVYELGDEFVRLALRYQNARPEAAAIEPLLHELAEQYGETAHYAILERPDVVYRAKVDPPSGAIRLSSTVGGRMPAYCTAVGKMLMSAQLHTADQLDEWLGDTPLAARTPRTITDRAALLAELNATRERGFAVDDQENEIGVNCVAFPMTLGTGHRGAVSISALAYRRGIDSLVAAAPAIQAAITRHLGGGASSA